MSILIKGMEMPENCTYCEWSYYVGNGRAMCKKVSMTDKTDIMTKRRADFCPLIEVPPHGRLIDADKLSNQKYENIWTNHLIIDADDLDDALTVIEAEKGF